MPNELVTNRLANFDPIYRDFVMSDFTEVVSAEIANTYNLSEDATIALENMTFLYLTLILHKFDFIESLVTEVGLSIPKAIAAVDIILQKMPVEMVIAQEQAYAEITNNPNETLKEKDRYEFLKKVPLNKQTTYLYAKTSTVVNEFTATYNLSEDQKLILSTLIGDLVLGFYKTTDTVPLLQQELSLEPRVAALLGVEVIEFITPLTNPNWQLPETLQRTESTFVPSNIPVKAPAVTPESAPSNVSENTYNLAASYAAVSAMSHAAPVTTNTPAALSTIPSYTPIPTTPTPAPAPTPDRPRWSTEI